MGLEAGGFISDLVTTNPVSGDSRSQGDDHLRLIKTAVKTTFPNASKAFYFPAASSKSASGAVVAADINSTIYVTTTSAAVVLTMPSLVLADAGWECAIVKITTDVNPVFIAPPSGTIQSGEYASLARCRRCVPGRRTRVYWTGTAWMAERVISEPIGAILDFTFATAPVGYELAYGQTLASASTNYPEFYAANGSSGVVPDHRGRISAGQDDMGGSSANRLTGLTDGINGDTLGTTGGLESTTLALTQIPSHNHTITDAGHTHSVKYDLSNRTGGAATVIADISSAGGSTATAAATSSTTGISLAAAGGGLAHNNVQPTIITNKLVVVE